MSSDNDSPASNQPGVAWAPSPDQLRQSNVYWLMQQVGVTNYDDLYAWSVRQRADYWRLAVERLGMRLHRPAKQMLDDSDGSEHARWMVGAEWNTADSCFAAPGQSAAILHQTDGGSLRTMTVAQLDALSNRVARSLSRWGIGPGDAVAVILPMTAEAVAAYLGIVKCGAAAVGIAESFSTPEIDVRLQLGRARRVLTQDVVQRGNKRHDIYARLRSCDAPPTVVLPVEDHVRVSLRRGDLTWDQFLSTDESWDNVPRQPQDAIGVLFSSGTTGQPKAIPWTNLCPIKCAADAHFHHDVHPGDVLAWPTSLGWMMGPWLIFASLMNRATMALYDGMPTGEGFARFVQQAGVTMLGMVPGLVAAWRASGCLDGVDWTGLKAFSSTGECSNPDDMRWLMQQAGGRPVIEYCGGTEIAGGYITGTIAARPCVPATFNTPALGLDFVILDEAGRPADQGELFLIPPSIGLSTDLLNRDHHAVYYAGCPAGPGGETLRRHGDEIQSLPGGYWRAHGRVDDTMNLAGIKVSAAEIERVLQDIEAVRELAVVAETPPQGGPCQLVVYSVLSEPRPEDELRRAMQAALAQRLNPLFKVHRVVLLDALPRTASNKVMRRLLRDRVDEPLGNDSLEPPGDAAT